MGLQHTVAPRTQPVGGNMFRPQDIGRHKTPAIHRARRFPDVGLSSAELLKPRPKTDGRTV